MSRWSVLGLVLCLICLATPDVSAGQLLGVLPVVRWLAMGDSYAAGEGVSGAGNSRWSGPSTRDHDGTCQRSDHAWAPLAYQQLAAGHRINIAEFNFVACTGAVITGSTNNLDDQLREAGIADDSRPRYDLITFSFGGNDLDFADIVKQCLGSLGGNFTKTAPYVVLPACTASDQEYQQLLARAAQHLAILFPAIEKKVTSGGHIVVLGYPLDLADPTTWPYLYVRGAAPQRSLVCNGIGAADAVRLRKIGIQLNKEIVTAAAGFANVRFVGVASEFETHDLCSGGQEWINGYPTVFDPTGTSRFPQGSCPISQILFIRVPTTACRISRTFHPNDAAHRSEAGLVANVVGTLDWSHLGTGSPATTSPPPSAGACAPDADVLAAVKSADPGLADFATVSDLTCAGDEVAAWIDQSASGLAALLRRQNGRLVAIAVGGNVCGDPDVQTSPPAIRSFFNC